ncbi:type VI immunity family protein [Pseudoduganella albidiflava]|nr:type VI immunity family protein [Pseudoduganella albidiflava]GGY36852.1 hypothetical protein GCM10007387_18990 [Pseudoduganella albidiflava]
MTRTGTKNATPAAGDITGAQAIIELAEDVRLVALGYTMSVYTNKLLSQQPKGVLSAYDRYLRLYQRDLPPYYATENMNRHKKASKATFDMLATWLQPGAPPREFISLDLQATESPNDAPRDSFHVYGTEPAYPDHSDDDARVVAMSLDPAVCDAATLLEVFVETCSAIEFRSALAGFGMNTSRYEEEEAQTHAWAMGMRFRALDIPRMVDDALAVGSDGVKGVGWLTALGPEILDQLGGKAALRKALPAEVALIDLPNGIVLKAGEAPILGDRNRREPLAHYQKIYGLLAPWIDRAAKRSPSFNLETDYVDRTEAWFHRLADA